MLVVISEKSEPVICLLTVYKRLQVLIPWCFSFRFYCFNVVHANIVLDQSPSKISISLLSSVRATIAFGLGFFQQPYRGVSFTIVVHGVYALNFCSFKHLSTAFDLSFVCFRMYEECIFFSPMMSSWISSTGFKDYVMVIFDICHYAYTSSTDATASLVTTTVLCFITYTFIVFTVAVCTSAMFLAESTHVLIIRSCDNQSFLSFRFVALSAFLLS